MICYHSSLPALDSSPLSTSSFFAFDVKTRAKELVGNILLIRTAVWGRRSTSENWPLPGGELDVEPVVYAFKPRQGKVLSGKQTLNEGFSQCKPLGGISFALNSQLAFQCIN